MLAPMTYFLQKLYIFGYYFYCCKSNIFDKRISPSSGPFVFKIPAVESRRIEANHTEIFNFFTLETIFYSRVRTNKPMQEYFSDKLWRTAVSPHEFEPMGSSRSPWNASISAYIVKIWSSWTVSLSIFFGAQKVIYWLFFWAFVEYSIFL